MTAAFSVDIIYNVKVYQEKYIRRCVGLKCRIREAIPMIAALILGIVSAFCLMIYASPMEDLSLDLALGPREDTLVDTTSDYDSKGWTVYTQEGETVTELTPNGIGGYTGLELGQTFYYSRVMSEELDSPTLQLGVGESTVSIWLDDVLIYTDFPEQENRIGYLHLPMNEWYRDPITVSLPMDYHGKTLTIAQSFPEWTETGSVKAWPADILLYCGYAYESGLISETFQTAAIAGVTFLLVLILLASFVRSGDWSILCVAVVAFCAMANRLISTSFFGEYFDPSRNSLNSILPLISALALLIFLTIRGGKHRKIMWTLVGLCALSLVGYAVVITASTHTASDDLFAFLLVEVLPRWVLFAAISVAVVFGVIYWRKESWFYRVFTPTALVCVLASWLAIILFLEKGVVWQQITVSLASGQIHYIYQRTIPAITVAALLTAVAEFIHTELNRRAEQQILEERREMAQITYESMCSQHEEIMKLRHDMAGHLETLRGMSDSAETAAYIDNLIGKNRRVRSIVHTGNEVLDIILNSKLSAAMDAGIHVEIVRSTAPEKLPIPDDDLSSIVINILSNALKAAKASNAEKPFLKLDVHIKGSWLAIVCENSADIRQVEKKVKKETVPKHGLGLKIIEETAKQHNGLFDTEYGQDYYKVSVVLPVS